MPSWASSEIEKTGSRPVREAKDEHGNTVGQYLQKRRKSQNGEKRCLFRSLLISHRKKKKQ